MKLHFVTEEHLIFLDALRESGQTNMLAAGPYLEKEFGLEESESIKILSYWAKNFGKDDS